VRLNSRRTRGCATSQTTLLAVALLTFMGASVLWSVSGKSAVTSPGKSPHHQASPDRITTDRDTTALAPQPSSLSAPLASLKVPVSSHRLLVAGRLPLAFEPNQGQTGKRAAYISHGAGYGLFLTPNEAILALGAPSKASDPANAAVHMQFEGAARDLKIAASKPLPGKTNYFRGNDPSRWVRNVPTFARVNYGGVYPGVDLVFYGKQGKLEYDFTVRAGADPAQIRLGLSGVDNVSLEPDGSLSLNAASREVRWNKPTIYQEVDGHRRPVTGAFQLLAQNRVGFMVGPYDHSRDLVIDPVLAYATFFGGAGDEINPQVAVDPNANIYLSGTTSSAIMFPTEVCGNPAQPLCLSGATDVFVSKLDSVGTSVIYTTYLNGLSIPAPTALTPYGNATGADSSAGLAIDNQGDAYIVGTTTSADFPVTPNAFQATPVTAQAHVFLTKLDPTGANLLYSSYLSGSNTDSAMAVAVNNTGGAYILGSTQSVTDGDFPTGTSFQQHANGATNLYFVAQFDTSQTVGSQTLKFFSYLGGGTSSTDPAIPANGVVCAQLPCGGIVLDTTGNAYVAVGTTFTNLPVANAFQSSLHGTGTSDAYLAKIAANGSAILYSTYLGGSGNDAANAVAIDSSGNAYLTGSTTSTDFPLGTAHSFNTLSGAQDAFIAKLNNPATGPLTLTFTSYLGGSGTETGYAIVTDSSQGVYVVGSTNSSDFPTAPSGTLGAKGTDAFVAKFNTSTATSLSSFVSSSLLGGSLTDRATSIVQNSNGAVLVAGETNSTDFPVKGINSLPPLQAALNGTGSGSNRDVFLANFGPSTDLSLAVTVAPNPVAIGSAATFTYTVKNNGPDSSTGAVLTIPIPSADVLGGTLGTFTAGSSSCVATGTSPNQTETCTLGTIASGSTASVTVPVTPAVFTTGSNAGNPPATVGMSGHVSPGNTAVDLVSSNDSSPTVKATVEFFTTAIAPSSESVAAGQTATYTVTVTPNTTAGFPTSITLACLPPTTPVALASTTCTFTPTPIPSIPSTSGTATSVLKITTTKPTQTASVRSVPTFWYAMWLPICGMALFGAGSSRRRRWVSTVALVVLLGTIAWLPACGSKSTATTTTGTQPGTYSIGITATSGTYVYPPASSPRTISLTVTN